MRIAVDVMGGDLGPRGMVAGAARAFEEYGSDMILVGDERIIRSELRELGKSESPLEIMHAPESISMDEDPLSAVRHKRDSSLVVGARLVRDGSAGALVSAGSTGALVAAGPLVVGRIPGVARPALATPIPTTGNPCVMLDVGANPECRPEHLLQFAVLGAAYAASVFHIERPRVGLLSNGAEASKGNAVTVAAHKMLEDQSRLEFVGNVESRLLLQGVADVIVTDGFTGNIALKLMEGVGLTIFEMVREAAASSMRAKVGGLLMKPALRSVKARMDYSEYGGAPLLGLSGLLVKAHGSSNAKAFANAIRVAGEAMDSGLTLRMREGIGNLGAIPEAE
ncbi:MAG: phosphate acyltransferase PlsX [Clostridia bacterium]|nr:phosphate acyltransferase PlsX [Clostridia bacterium]